MCCKNLKAILEASGSEIGKVVRVGVFLTDMKVCDFESGSTGGLGKPDGLGVRERWIKMLTSARTSQR